VSTNWRGDSSQESEKHAAEWRPHTRKVCWSDLLTARVFPCCAAAAMLSRCPGTQRGAIRFRTQAFALIVSAPVGLNPIAARLFFSANSLPVIPTFPNIPVCLFFPAPATRRRIRVTEAESEFPKPDFIPIRQSPTVIPTAFSVGKTSVLYSSSNGPGTWDSARCRHPSGQQRPAG